MSRLGNTRRDGTFTESRLTATLHTAQGPPLRDNARHLRVSHARSITTDRGKRPLIEHAGLELLDREHMIEVAGADVVAFAKHTLLRAFEGLRDRVGHAILHSGDYGLLDLYAMVLLLEVNAARSRQCVRNARSSPSRSGISLVYGAVGSRSPGLYRPKKVAIIL